MGLERRPGKGVISRGTVERRIGQWDRITKREAKQGITLKIMQRIEKIGRMFLVAKLSGKLTPKRIRAYALEIERAAAEMADTAIAAESINPHSAEWESHYMKLMKDLWPRLPPEIQEELQRLIGE